MAISDPCLCGRLALDWAIIEVCLPRDSSPTFFGQLKDASVTAFSSDEVTRDRGLGGDHVNAQGLSFGMDLASDSPDCGTSGRHIASRSY